MAHPDGDFAKLMKASGITDEDVPQDYAQMLAEMEEMDSDEDHGAEEMGAVNPPSGDPPPPSYASAVENDLSAWWLQSKR